MRREMRIAELVRRWPTAPALAAAVLYGGTMAAAYPYRHVFELDRDEGINAGKARLLEHGYALYTQVWNDQPPLFTHLLRAWFDAFGWDLDHGRGLVLVFAAALVFAVYDLTRLADGHRAAAIAALALAASAYVQRLSVSLMIGLPAIALATLAIWALFRWLDAPRVGWLLASAALFGASLATKLFTAFLLPVIALWLLAVTPADQARLRPALLWVVSALVMSSLLLLALAGPQAAGQLLAPHLAGRHAPALQHFDARGLLLTGGAEWLLSGLGGAAFAWLIWHRRTYLLIFPAWALTALAVLLTHAPVWYHHQLLLTVPYCPAIGVWLAELSQHSPRSRGWLAMQRGAACLAIVALLSAAALHVLRAPRPPAADPRQAVVAALRQHLGPRRIAISTDPIYAFRAGASMPPGLAVLSDKRAATDLPFEAEIAAAFEDGGPEAVALGPSAAGIDAALQRGMGERYAAVFATEAGGGITVYARRDLLTTAHP